MHMYLNPKSRRLLREHVQLWETQQHLPSLKKCESLEQTDSHKMNDRHADGLLKDATIRLRFPLLFMNNVAYCLVRSRFRSSISLPVFSFHVVKKVR